MSTQEDVERKLKIYGAIQALRQGRLPDNKQLDDALVFVRDKIVEGIEEIPSSESKAQDKGRAFNLSQEGRSVVLDVRDIVETTRQLVKQNNPNEVLQDFVHDIFSVQLPSSNSNVELPVSLDEARKDGETAIHHLRTLLRLILTNKEARKLLKDSKLILRDLFAQTAVAVAERARPSAQEMLGLDDAAPAQDWAVSADEGEGEGAHTNKNLEYPNRNEQRVLNGPEFNTLELERGMDEERHRARKSQENMPPTDGQEDSGGIEDSKEPLNLNFRDRLRSIAGRVPEKHRARVQQEYDGAKAYLHEEFPPDRRNQFIWRLKKVVAECQATEAYQSSISWFLTVIHGYFTNTRALATSHASQTNELFAGDPLLTRAISELRMLAEQSAGGQSLDTVLKHVDVLWNDSKEDAEMRKWWENVEIFLRKTLLKPGYITSPEFTSQSRKLQSSGRFFFTQKYKTHTDSLLQAAQTWSRALLDDPLHNRFFNEWGKFTRDLLFDDKGILVFKSDLWKDMRTVILPAIVRKVGVIPIPRIEYIDKDLDLVIENLTLQGENLFPKAIEINANHYSKLFPFAAAEDKHRNSLTLTFSGIQADMKDVAFQYRKKLRLGGVKDEGLADVFVSDNGITIKIKLTTTGGGGHARHPKSLFIVDDVSVKVEHLKFSIKESNHDFLYKTLRPIATRLIKKQISKAFSDGIRAALEYADEQLAAVRDKMADAKAEDGSRREVLKKLSHKQSSEVSPIKSKRESTFRVVPQRKSMLLSDMGHKKGWMQRQTVKDNRSADGKGWRSDAFDITSATRG